MVRPPCAHRGVLGQDRDALFALQVTGVDHAVGDLGADPERAGLPQHGVDQRGLAVVDVRDDGDVAQFVTGGELGLASGHTGISFTSEVGAAHTGAISILFAADHRAIRRARLAEPGGRAVPAEHGEQFLVGADQVGLGPRPAAGCRGAADAPGSPGRASG